MATTHFSHPGVFLLEEYLEPMGISQYRVAKDIGIPLSRINAIVNGKRSITADTAIRLAKYFGMSEQFWLNAQAHYDLEVAKARNAAEFRAIAPLKVASGLFS